MILKWALKNRRRTVTTVVVVFGLSLCTIPIAGMDFFGAMDQGVANITVELPNGTDLDTTEEATLEILYRLQDISEVDTVYANVGSGIMASGTNSASVTVNLVEKSDRRRSTNEVCEEIEDLLADIAQAIEKV